MPPNVNGNQADQIPVQVHFPPALGEALGLLTAQKMMPDGKLWVEIVFCKPGTTVTGVVNPDDCERWGNQLLHYAKMSKAGLSVVQK